MVNHHIVDFSFDQRISAEGFVNKKEELEARPPSNSLIIRFFGLPQGDM
jgi:hypothetical protein